MERAIQKKSSNETPLIAKLGASGLPPIGRRHIRDDRSQDVRPKLQNRLLAEETTKLVIKDPIIHSIRKSNYFDHDEKVAVVMVCRSYD